MRNRWLALAALALGVILGGFSLASASATAPGPLDAGYITDRSGVVSSADLSQAQSTLERLRTEARIDLFIVLVPDYTDPSDAEQWTDATAGGNGLTADQYLISVATEGRNFTMWRHDDGRMTVAERDRILDAMLPDLRDSDFSAAVVAAADEAYDIYVLGPQRSAQTWVIIGIVVLAGVVVLVVVLLVRRARKRAAERAKREEQIQETAQQASIALVRADDLVRSSEQELEYARAQFGDEVIGAFVTALQTSRANLDEAFSLKQKLDDEVPDTDEKRLAWNERVLQLCSESTRVLEERKAEFDALRQLEQNAPAALENVRRRRSAAGTEIDRAAQILAVLSSAYASGVVSPVAENVTEAGSRMTFTDAQITEAERQIAAGETGEAAVSIRAAEGAVQQATQLEDAVEKLQVDLQAADDRAQAIIAELNGDLQSARALPDPQGTVAQAVASAEQAIRQAHAHLGSEGRDPVAALRVLDAANATIDSVIAQVRDEQARIQRARTLLADAVRRADLQISSAERFIVNRRGAVQSPARTRLAEAQSARSQAIALAETDPVQALALAQHADRLATQALRLAQNDVDSWGGGYRGGGSSDTLGALLGGILIGQATGGRGRGGFGGGGFGGGGFGGGGGILGGGSSGGGGFFGGGGGGGFSVGGFGGGSGGSSGGGGRF
ncbi:TPM domain-containing protein [Microbacterium sp. NPDC058345]|uniref:TPM domain-containing protein n=1 Tax=Microbacterium sp. NPDC058345 TaxID=3346455 RepID=UPI00365F9066